MKQLSALLILFLLSACADTGETGHREKRRDCPPVALDSQLQTLTLYADGGGPMNGSAIATARLVNFQNACTVNAQVMIVDMRFDLDAVLLTPQPKPQSEIFPYVLAVSDDAGNLMGEQFYKPAIIFAPNTQHQTMHQTLRQVVPLKGRDPANYQVAVGFAVARKSTTKGSAP